jgi:hypothetical protein
MSAAKGAIMNVTSILAQLNSERGRIEKAIAAIESLNSTGRRSGKPTRMSSTPKRRHRRIGAAARARLSRLMKQRWAQGKMGKKASTKPAQTSKPVRRISAAGRKRIAEATKRRWAEWRRIHKKPVARAA